MPESHDVGRDTAPSFDLTTRPWVEVLRLDGTQEVLSLREVFAQAAGLRRLVGDLPTQEFALLRLLLAVAHDALEGPQDIEDWSDLWSDPECFAPVGAYLDAHRGRFDLLHTEAPFFQTAGLRTEKDEVFPLHRIVADVPNGEPFFTARLPTVERLSFAEAARWVVHAHAYDTSGIKTGPVGDVRAKGGRTYPSADLGEGWLGKLGAVYVEGQNLRETLLLNLIAWDTDCLRVEQNDKPAWRRDPCGPGGEVRNPTGLRDLYTWQSRRIRLHYDDVAVIGVVLGYGDPLEIVNRFDREPMTSWKRSHAAEKELRRSPVYKPLRHDHSRAAWRGLDAMLVGRSSRTTESEPSHVLRPVVMEWVARLVAEGELRRGHLISACTIGMAYDPPWAKKPAKSSFFDVHEDRVSMAVVLLDREEPCYARTAMDAAKDSERAVQALTDLAANLKRATGSEYGGACTAASALGFAALDGPYRSWLSSLTKLGDPEEQRSHWQREVHRIVGRLGDRLIAEAGDAAWQGRIVELKKRTEWLNATLARLWFRRALDECLAHPLLSADQPPGAEAAPAPITS
ncbi:type I-E CRISPR-associated protein Cse1/CasA [Streptomyces sp. GSL17-111]|uniref:type I-E CRISPR-associated protein Cse1/CasA n=1 Tax=Streptomyces sp. GSL17-111 TaxID=3121596 RepID=UPI0030F4658F